MPADPILKIPRERKTCEHCKTVHNKKKDVPFGCPVIAKELSKKSKWLISEKGLGQPESDSSSDSGTSESSAQGSIYGPEKWDSASKSSS